VNGDKKVGDGGDEGVIRKGKSGRGRWDKKWDEMTEEERKEIDGQGEYKMIARKDKVGIPRGKREMVEEEKAIILEMDGRELRRRIGELISVFSYEQLIYVMEVIFVKSKEKAMENTGISASMVRKWGEKIDYAIRLLNYDRLISAQEIERGILLKAIQVKMQGLESKNEWIRQRTSTEVREWILGKPSVKKEVNFRGKLEIENVDNVLQEVYGKGVEEGEYKMIEENDND
jgi:hypothetical protein